MPDEELVLKLRADTKDYEDSFRRVQKSTEQVNKKLTDVAQTSSRQVQQAFQGQLRLTDRLRTASTSLSGAVNKLQQHQVALRVATLASAAAYGVAIKSAADFEKRMTNVATLVDTAKVNINAMAKETLTLIPKTAQSASQLADGLFLVVSAGIAAKDSVQVMTQAARLATAGFSDTATTVDALTTVLNAYALAGSEAGRVSDALFKAQEVGKTTISEMAATIGAAVPVAAALNVSFEDLFAAVATLTQGGLATTEAVTAVRSALISTLKETDEAGKAAEKLGISWNAAAIKTMGFVGVLEQLRGRTDVAESDIMDLVGRVEGMNAILALTGQQYEGFMENLEKVRGSIGATDVAFKKQSETFKVQADILKNQLNAAFITLGEEILPSVTTALENANTGLSSFIAKWNELPDSVRDLATGAGGIAVGVLGAATATGIAAKIITSLGGSGAAIAGGAAAAALVAGVSGVRAGQTIVGAATGETSRNRQLEAMTLEERAMNQVRTRIIAISNALTDMSELAEVDTARAAVRRKLVYNELRELGLSSVKEATEEFARLEQILARMQGTWIGENLLELDAFLKQLGAARSPGEIAEHRKAALGLGSLPSLTRTETPSTVLRVVPALRPEAGGPIGRTVRIAGLSEEAESFEQMRTRMFAEAVARSERAVRIQAATPLRGHEAGGPIGSVVRIAGLDDEIRRTTEELRAEALAIANARHERALHIKEMEQENAARRNLGELFSFSTPGLNALSEDFKLVTRRIQANDMETRRWHKTWQDVDETIKENTNSLERATGWWQKWGNTAITTVREVAAIVGVKLGETGAAITDFLSKLSLRDIPGAVSSGARFAMSFFEDAAADASQWANSVGNALAQSISDSIAKGFSSLEARHAIEDFMRNMVRQRLIAQITDQLVQPALKNLGKYIDVQLGEGSRKTPADILADPEFLRLLSEVTTAGERAFDLAGGALRHLDQILNIRPASQEEINAVRARLKGREDIVQPTVLSRGLLTPGGTTGAIASTPPTRPGGLAVSEITGPTRDLLIAAVNRMNMEGVNNRLDSIREVLVDIRDGIGGLIPLEEIPIGDPNENAHRSPGLNAAEWLEAERQQGMRLAGEVA